jgi:hypothetical protein
MCTVTTVRMDVYTVTTVKEWMCTVTTVVIVKNGSNLGGFSITNKTVPVYCLSKGFPDSHRRRSSFLEMWGR